MRVNIRTRVSRLFDFRFKTLTNNTTIILPCSNMEAASNMERARNGEIPSNMGTTGSIDTTSNIDTRNNMETSSTAETVGTTETPRNIETTSDDKCIVCAKDCDGVACELCEATPYCGDVCEEADLYVRIRLSIGTGRTS
jgi:hypothetical protein